MARFIFRSLLRKPRVTIQKSAAFASLSFFGYTCYDHLYPRSIVQQQKCQNPSNFTLYTTPSTSAYPRLPDQRSIRLIKLYGAASQDDDIYTDLITASIDKPPPYEALSYTWGGQPKDQAIYANGQEFLITENAQDAMRQLRPKPGEVKYLWIDAICINQEDISEKSSQVSMMVEIYKKATRVDIWLGNASDSTNFILNWYRLITLPLAPVLWIERQAMSFYTPGNTSTDVLLLLCRKTFLAARLIAFILGFCIPEPLPVLKDWKTKLAHREAELESKPYWTRVWTIQESNTNPNCVILCGSSAPIHCDAFYQASVITFSLRVRVAQRHWRTYGIHLDHRERIHLANKGYHPTTLRALCHKESTEEVDKIYAMRHKLPDAFGTVPIDYSPSAAAKVYTHAAHGLLEAHHNVQFLRFACHRDRSDGLSTWVPDWKANSHWPCWIMDEKRFPAPPHPALVSKGLNENVLKIKGLRVDTITIASDVLPRIIPDENAYRTFKLGDYPCIPRAVDILQAWVTTLSSTTGGSIHVNQFFQMITRLTTLREKPDRIHQSLKSIHYRKDGSYNIQARPQDIPRLEFALRQMLDVTDEQCFFLTTNGQVGLSRAPVCKGDEIVLLTGESLPYIIRKSRRRGRYTVVSPCFLSNGRWRKSWVAWDWEGPTKQLLQKADYENWKYIELV